MKSTLCFFLGMNLVAEILVLVDSSSLIVMKTTVITTVAWFLYQAYRSISFWIQQKRAKN